MARLRSRPLWRRSLLLALALTALVLHLAAVRVERRAAGPEPHLAAVPYSEAAARWVSRDPGLSRALAEVAAEERFRAGETLSDVLDGLGLEPAERERLIAALEAHADPRKLRPRDSYAALRDESQRLREFRLTLSGRGQVAVRWAVDGWQGSWRPFVRSTRVRRLEGVLEGSLEGSIQRAGGSSGLAYQMAEVLQWDLDFNRDLRLGDRFEILFEEIFLDGGFEAIGAVMALRYDNGGRVHEAYRFGEPPGYYDGDGRPLRKLFLRSPLRYSRVTSRFSQRRFHPVLKRYRPHYGVDYGAPVGTPVRVTADGRVAFAGWDRGGGKTVKVRHPNGFLTAYLHLSGFASGIRPGRRVSQGDTIGYVGSTGLATGPHLDYRVQRNGRWINPLAMTAEPAAPIPENLLAVFASRRDELRRALRPESVDPAAPAAGDRLANLPPPVSRPASRPLATGS